jgi:hypothetical protein
MRLSARSAGQLRLSKGFPLVTQIYADEKNSLQLKNPRQTQNDTFNL